MDNVPKSLGERISIHHVGGRDGSRAFPICQAFEGDIINVLYDADEDCVGQIKERNQRLTSEIHVLPAGLADACKNAELNINFDPYTSSRRDLNPKSGTTS